MSTKDEIIKKVSSWTPGLRDFVMILFPTFDTFYLDDNDVLYLSDKAQRKGISIAVETADSLLLQIETHGPLSITSTTLRLTVLNEFCGRDDLNDLGDNNSGRIELDVL
jgi:hypothetical protein